MILSEIIISLLLFLGSMLVMFGALGVHRFADPLCRSHALGKASSLGSCLSLSGFWMAMGDDVSGLKVLLVITFCLLTIPMASHLVALYVYSIQGTEVTLKPDSPATEQHVHTLKNPTERDSQL